MVGDKVEDNVEALVLEVADKGNKFCLSAEVRIGALVVADGKNRGQAVGCGG